MLDLQPTEQGPGLNPRPHRYYSDLLTAEPRREFQKPFTLLTRQVIVISCDQPENNTIKTEIRETVLF